jgi:hypothetical protein
VRITEYPALRNFEYILKIFCLALHSSASLNFELKPIKYAVHF